MKKALLLVLVMIVSGCAPALDRLIGLVAEFARNPVQSVECYTTAYAIVSETKPRASVRCPADCANGGTVWGTMLYTDDSAICVAALHAGLLSVSGGIVTLEYVTGQEGYIGSTRNGITTSEWGSWGHSFRFRQP